jgi:hypothetical protein
MPRRRRERKSDATIEDVKMRHETGLMLITDVVGVAIGEKNRKPCLVVYVAKMSSELVEAVPKQIEGFIVYIEESDEFVALAP